MRPRIAPVVNTVVVFQRICAVFVGGMQQAYAPIATLVFALVHAVECRFGVVHVATFYVEPTKRKAGVVGTQGRLVGQFARQHVLVAKHLKQTPIYVEIHIVVVDQCGVVAVGNGKNKRVLSYGIVGAAACAYIVSNAVVNLPVVHMRD